MSLNLDEKVQVKNLCTWDLFFPKIESIGSVRIPSGGRIRLSRGEIQSQVDNGTRMFVGTDGMGAHAKIYIEDKDTRVLVGFETEDEKDAQKVVTVDTIKRLLDYKTKKAFEDNVKKEVKLDSEKSLLFETAKKAKLNDYDKIKFIEEYTGFKFDTAK
ncbi:hypothetical protein ACU3L3_06835 [Priestia endophytica]